MPTIIICSKKDGKGKGRQIVDHSEKMSDLSSVTIIPCAFKGRCEALGLDPATTSKSDLDLIEKELELQRGKS